MKPRTIGYIVLGFGLCVFIGADLLAAEGPKVADAATGQTWLTFLLMRHRGVMVHYVTFPIWLTSWTLWAAGIAGMIKGVAIARKSQ